MMIRNLLVVVIVLAPLSLAAESPQRVLLLAQKPDGHPAGTHEYHQGQQILAGMLRRQQGLEVEILAADEPWAEGPAKLKTADGVVLFLAEGAAWTSARGERLAAFQELAGRRGGLVCLHWATGTRNAASIKAFVDLYGGCHGGPDRKYVFTEAAVRPGDHPAAAGLKESRKRDEFYYRLKFPAERAGHRAALQAKLEEGWETVAWGWERPDGGRSFGFTGLHFHDNWADLDYRRLVVQGTLWSLGREIPQTGLTEKELALPESP